MSIIQQPWRPWRWWIRYAKSSNDRKSPTALREKLAIVQADNDYGNNNHGASDAADDDDDENLIEKKPAKETLLKHASSAEN